MTRARLRLLVLTALPGLGLALVAACGSFSGTDSTDAGIDSPDTSTSFDGSSMPEADAGTSPVHDGSSDSVSPSLDGSVPPTCAVNDAGTVFCDSFEGNMIDCGGWITSLGSGQRIVGGAHGGAAFCRFCGVDNAYGIDRTFAYSGYPGLKMLAWVRAAPDASMTTQATIAFYGKDTMGNNVMLNASTVVPSDTWQPIGSTITDASAVISEHAYIFPGPFKVYNCIDIDDVQIDVR